MTEAEPTPARALPDLGRTGSRFARGAEGTERQALFRVGLAVLAAGAAVTAAGAAGALPLSGSERILPGLATLFAGAALAAGGALGPSVRAAERARRIDEALPAALAFAAAGEAAGEPVEAILRGLAQERAAFGALSEEAGRVLREIDFLGADPVTALRYGARTTPSLALRELLSAAASAAETGGDTEGFFLAHARSYAEAQPQRDRRLRERLSALSEAYVTLAVAFPLLLLVLVTAFAFLGAGGLGLVWVVALVVTPLMQGGFLAAFRWASEAA